VLLAIAFLLGAALKTRTSQRDKKLFVILSFSLIFLINALRAPDIGIDLAHYYAQKYASFAYIPWGELQSVTISGDWELGFCVFCKLLTYISKDVQLFIIMSSVVTTIPFGYFIYKNSEDVVLSTVLFITYNIMFSNMNIIRQAMAVGILLIGYEYLKQKRYISYIIWVGISMLFHKSAIVALLMIAANIFKLNRKKMFILLIVIGLIPATYSVVFNYFLNIPFLSDSYDIYLTISRHAIGYVNRNSLYQASLPLFALALNMLVLKPWQKHTDEIETRSSLKVISLKKGKLFIRHNLPHVEKFEDSTIVLGTYLAAICRVFTFFVFIVGRLNSYFTPFVLLAVPLSISRIRDAKLRKFIRILLYICMTLLFLYFGFKSAGSQYGTVPYKIYNN
jgi:hypothetical protein